MTSDPRHLHRDDCTLALIDRKEFTPASHRNARLAGQARSNMTALKNALVGLAVLGAAACATKGGDEPSGPEVVAEGPAVYVLNVATEQDARASAVSVCRGRGGSAVFNRMLLYHRHEDAPPYHYMRVPAARFDCTK